jgi:hypothetical protein
MSDTIHSNTTDTNSITNSDTGVLARLYIEQVDTIIIPIKTPFMKLINKVMLDTPFQ